MTKNPAVFLSDKMKKGLQLQLKNKKPRFNSDISNIIRKETGANQKLRNIKPSSFLNCLLYEIHDLEQIALSQDALTFTLNTSI